MTYRISKTFSFEAAHHLLGLSEGHPCGHNHGHSYLVELVLQGPLDKHGFVLDYGELSPFEDYIHHFLDHHDLNNWLPDNIQNPTAESIAYVLLREAVRLFGDLVYAVRVSETAKTWAEYIR